MFPICCLHWIAALTFIFTSWNVRLWIQVIQHFTLNLHSYYIINVSTLHGTQKCIYLFHINLADQNMPALDRRETIRLSIIQWEKRKIRFLSEGINDHGIIFTISFVWVDILLFSLKLDVVFFHWCLLSGNKPMMHVKNHIFAILQIFFARMSFDDEWDHRVIFSNIIYLLKLKSKYWRSMKSFVFLAKKKCDVCRICKDDLVCLEFVT